MTIENVKTRIGIQLTRIFLACFRTGRQMWGTCLRPQSLWAANPNSKGDMYDS